MSGSARSYADRVMAGCFLAEKLLEYKGQSTIVVGLPRGGVVVAAEIARSLSCPLDVIVAGKLRAPFNPELAIGAVTEDGRVFLNKGVITGALITDAYIEKEKKARLSAVLEKLKLYRKVKGKTSLKDRTVIIVDDGLATGATMIAAVQAAKAEGAAKIIVAVPGGPMDTVERIKGMEEVDTVVCPVIPEEFFAVSQLYLDFTQTQDSEVVGILKEFSGKEFPAGG
ncbi:MAG: phosphoribosyltransferase [Deltaproteobacteria bacterium]|nr:phosphoribosyltransferase [Deltaproteobacteria bacterium]